jgi:hypothetical protein
MNQSPDRKGRGGRQTDREAAGQTFAELDDNIEPLDLPD